MPCSGAITSSDGSLLVTRARAAAVLFDMAKIKTVYRCAECGAEHARWGGRCDACGEWNTLGEEIAAPAAAKRGTWPCRRRAAAGRCRGAETPRLREITGSETARWRTGLGEFDFVLGGGVVPGSMVLLGGEPGAGKSTLLLQVAARLQTGGHAALYVSGEESPLQVKLRADRLTDAAGDVALLCETNLETILVGGRCRAAAGADHRLDPDGLHG